MHTFEKVGVCGNLKKIKRELKMGEREKKSITRIVMIRFVPTHSNYVHGRPLLTHTHANSVTSLFNLHMMTILIRSFKYYLGRLL